MEIRGVVVMGKKLWIVQSICVAVFACVVFELTTSNILPLLVGALYAIATCKSDVQLTKKEDWITKILAVFYSMAVIVAEIKQIIRFDGLLSLFSLITCIVGAYSIFAFILRWVFVFFRKDYLIRPSVDTSKKSGWITFLCSFFVIMLCWGIGLAFSYPGNFNRDGRWILWQVIGIENYSVANPLIHTAMTDLLWNIGQALFGTPNGSVATISVGQFTFGAIVISYMVSRLYQAGVKKGICAIVVLFYAITPYNVQLMHTIWSDMPFAICTLWFVTMLWEEECVVCKERKLSYLMRQIVFVVAGTLMCLTRTNGYYAFLLFLPFGVILFWKNKKYVVLELFLMIILCNWVRGPVYDSIIKAELEKDVAELEAAGDSTDSVPLYMAENATSSHNSVGFYILTSQQLARVVVDRDLSVEEQEELSTILQIDKVKEEYNPKRADPVLHLVNKQVPITDYLSIWIRYGIEYPFSYLLAWCDSTSGYWYPDYQEWIYSDAVRENEMGIYKDSVLSEENWLKLQEYEQLYLDIPIYGMLWSIGFIVWLVFGAMGLTFVKCDWRKCLLYMPLVGIWASLLIASPVNTEFRYLYSFFLCLPLMVLIPFVSKGEEQKEIKTEIIE